MGNSYKVKVEHVSSKKLLPRMWWNSQAARGQALNEVKQLLDRQESAWNAMVGMWEQTGNPGVPPRSPKARQIQIGEEIQRFP